jgi:small lipoprotein (TIGR04452 family)
MFFRKYSVCFILACCLGASACIYTDAAGVVPPGAISGKEAIKRLKEASFAGSTIYAHMLTDFYASTGFKSDFLKDPAFITTNSLTTQVILAQQQVQADRNYDLASVEACEFQLKAIVPLLEIEVYKGAALRSTNGISNAQAAGEVAMEAAYVYTQQVCHLESTGRLLELGPLRL